VLPVSVLLAETSCTVTIGFFLLARLWCIVCAIMQVLQTSGLDHDILYGRAMVCYSQ